MPMKNDYTQCMDNMMENDKGKKGKKIAPGKQTLILLMQLARVYHVEPGIPKELCGLVIN